MNDGQTCTIIVLNRPQLDLTAVRLLQTANFDNKGLKLIVMSSQGDKPMSLSIPLVWINRCRVGIIIRHDSVSYGSGSL